MLVCPISVLFEPSYIRPLIGKLTLKIATLREEMDNWFDIGVPDKILNWGIDLTKLPLLERGFGAQLELMMCENTHNWLLFDRVSGQNGPSA